MPNSIIVGGTAYVMDVDYVTGALHRRVGLKSLYKDNGTSQWAAGHRNEANRQHIRFGMDVLTAPSRDAAFPEDEDYQPGLRDGGSGFRMSEANYRRDFFHATGAYIASKAVGGSPGQMRSGLAERGIFISTEDCGLLSSLHWFERRMNVEPLTPEQIEVVEALREPQRRILEICSDILDDDWNYHPQSDVISYRARRDSGWAASTVLKMQREGKGFLVSATGNGYVDITGQGVEAVRHLRNRDLEQGLEGLPEAKRAGRKSRFW